MLGDEATDLERLVIELALDRRVGDGWGDIASRLEYAPKQTRIDRESRAGAFENRLQRTISEIGVGTGEVENEFDGRAHHHVSDHGRKSISNVQALRFCRWTQTEFFASSSGTRISARARCCG